MKDINKSIESGANIEQRTTIKKLLKEGIIKESELEDLHVKKEGSDSNPIYKIEMHLTLLNATFILDIISQNK